MKITALISPSKIDSLEQIIKRKYGGSLSPYFLLNGWKQEQTGNDELDASLQKTFKKIIEETMLEIMVKAQINNLLTQSRFLFNCLTDAVKGNYDRFEEAMDQDSDAPTKGEAAVHQYLFSIICDKGSVTDLPHSIDQYAELITVLKQEDLFDSLSRYDEFMLALRANILLKRPFKDSLALMAEA